VSASIEDTKIWYLRNLVGFSIQLSLLPLSFELVNNAINGVLSNKATVACFLLAFFIAALSFTALLHSDSLRGLAARPLLMSLLPAGLQLLGCLILVLALNFDSALNTEVLRMTAFLCFGLGSALACISWERTLSMQIDSRLVTMISGWLVVNAVGFWLCATISQISIIAITAVAAVVSALLRTPPPSVRFQTRSANSLLSRITVNRYLLRFMLSLALLGFTGISAVFFSTTAKQGPSLTFNPHFLIFGCLVTFFILLLPLLLTRNIRPFISYALLIVPAMVAFFPIESATPLSHAFQVNATQIWLVCLFGAVALLIAHSGRLLHEIGYQTEGMGVTALVFGACLGALVFTPDWWRELIKPENPFGTVSASLIGLSSTILVYVSTNLLINAKSLRNTIYIARGHIPSSFAIYSDIADDEIVGNQKLQRTCYLLGTEKGLSPRELEVFVLLAQGRSLKRIQAELVIAEGTIITHRNSIYRKLDVHNKQELLDLVL